MLTSEQIERRGDHYAGLEPGELELYLLGPPDPTVPRDQKRAAAQLVALLTDLPPRWINDVATRRRG